MTDDSNKIPAVRDLISTCKNIVTKMHFEGDITEQKMMNACGVDVVAKLLVQIEAAFDVASCDASTPV